MEILRTDVLVLGAGLAGMRAAWAALEAAPNLRVLVAAAGVGPSGSSFANINDRLGMQVCLSDREREAFVSEAMAVAAPGYIDPALVHLLADESDRQFRVLAGLGFPFERDEQGEYLRATGCFSPQGKRAFLFTGLSEAFAKLKTKFLSIGGRFLEGWLVQDLIKGEAVCGALLRSAEGGGVMAVHAGAVILALGGPSSLFARNVSGPGNYGVSHALLSRAGSSVVNPSYVQFLWHDLSSGRFWPIQDALSPGARIRDRQGRERLVPESLFPMAGDRATHCPIGYGVPDAAVDQFFIEHLNPDGFVEVFISATGWIRVAPMAHAGNGGAKIDSNAWTGVPGLYACGESAGGMYGANRIGGAMVTATQVFGARAGKAAAEYAEAEGAVSMEAARAATILARPRPEDPAEREEILAWLRRGMQTFAPMGGCPGLGGFMTTVQDRLPSIRDWQARLSLEAALIVGRPTPE